MCVPCNDGILNIRAGAIIMKDERILMVGNEKVDYLYSVGGRIRFGETAEEAVIREVYEETGVGKLIYEISFYFYMKIPDHFSPTSNSRTEDNSKEHLKWIALGDNVKIYPEFFRTALKSPTDTVKHFVTDER